ncbi:MAG: amidohydrolase [Verrucomicrobiales bacterium]|nr:amidohydrolase [Verrucomicrobiales bacterium]
MVIDAHMHIWNKVHGLVNGEFPVRPLKSGMISIGEEKMLGMPAVFKECQALAEYVVGEFDASGVQAGVVVQEYLDGPQNDYLLSVQRNYPGRFFFHALPNFFNRDEVVSESRNLFERGFRGLKLCGGHLLGKVDLNDEVFFPLWELMESEGYVLAVDFSEGEIQVPQFEIILSKFPHLKVAIGHFGMPNRGGWPGQLNLCHHENVYMECGGIIWLYRSEGYPFTQALETIKKAASEVGYSKLMWGSDWPRTMVDFTYRQSLDFIREDDSIDEFDKELFLGKNAANLYGFKLENTNSPSPLITEG